jgi:hypothetical protein
MATVTKPPIRKSSPAAIRTGILIVTLLFIVWGAVFIYRSSFIAIDGQRYFCLFDDAMISMRYAWNFSHGNGLVWNAGETVMGYTNLLMTLIMSLATMIFDKPTAVLSIQILGIGLMLGIAYVTMKIAESMLPAEKRDQYPGFLIMILSFNLVLLYYPLVYWTLMGMETGLLTLLLLLAVYFAIQYTRNSRFTHLLLVSLCLGLAFMTRNDSILLAALIWVYISWKTIQDRNGRGFFQLLSAILVYSLFVIGQVLFQYLYYGDVFPNTYILKLTGMPLADRISNGLNFVFPFMVQTSFIFFIGISTLFLSFSREKLLFVALFLSALSYQIYVGGDPWNYWRMLSPVMPLLIILFLFAIVQRVSNNGGKNQKGAVGLRKLPLEIQVCILAFMGILVANAFFLPEIVFYDRPFYVSANQHNVNTALALQDVTTPDATAGVLWAGAIPYFSERKGIDFLGKSDRYIANLPPDLSGKVGANGVSSLPGHNKYDLSYSIGKLRPTFVQAFKWGSQDVSGWAETDYVKVEYKGMLLYLLKDSPTVLWDRIDAQ